MNLCSILICYFTNSIYRHHVGIKQQQQQLKEEAGGEEYQDPKRVFSFTMQQNMF